MVVVSMCDTSGDAPVFWRAEEDEQMHQSGLVCNFDYLQGPGCKIWMYCAVFSLLIYVASLSRKKKSVMWVSTPAGGSSSNQYHHATTTYWTSRLFSLGL